MNILVSNGKLYILQRHLYWFPLGMLRNQVGFFQDHSLEERIDLKNTVCIQWMPFHLDRMRHKGRGCNVDAYYANIHQMFQLYKDSIYMAFHNDNQSHFPVKHL